MQYLLSNKYWALEEGFFDKFASLMFKWVSEGNQPETFPFINRSQANLAMRMKEGYGQEEDYLPYSLQEEVAIIPIEGVITPKGDLCSNGIYDIINSIHHANTNNKVRAIVMDTDSQGGSVSGVQDLYRAILKSEKPVVALARNNMHSASYWVNAGATHIMASTPNTSFVGSIGVYLTHYDYSKQDEKDGLTVTYITSEKAIHKTLGNPHKPLSDMAMIVFQEEVNRLHETFIKDVEFKRKKSRKQGSDNYTGSSWDGEQALERGLIDSIAEDGLNSAIQKALELSPSKYFFKPII